MQRFKSLSFSFIFFLQVLLIFLLIVEDRIQLPLTLQVLGRLHPAILHLPIGLLFFFVIAVMLKREFSEQSFRKIALLILLITSLTASVTALLGFFLSRQGDYGGDALFQHKVSGTIFSLLCYVLLWVFDRGAKPQIAFYSLSALAIVFVLFTGHTGGTLTHGENYVLGPMEKSAQATALKDGTVFREVVYPILEKKCISCHNESKAKGKFVMTSLAEFQKGGKLGKEWTNGKPADSRMIRYIHLPVEDDHHMPPSGKPQLTKQEINVLEQWIKAGADVEKKLDDVNDGDSLKIAAAGLITSKPNETNSKEYLFPATSPGMIAKLNTPFRAVFPLYQNSPALQADFFIKEYFKTSSLDELKQVHDQLVVLNLSKMPVTDKELEIIGTFKNLEKLNLNFSKINGSGLSSLQSLKNLKSLSLAGTQVTMESLQSVLDLPALRELFIWNTAVTGPQVEELIRDNTRVAIMTTQFVDNKVLQLGKPILENEGIIKEGELVSLKHSMPGVVIRYTLDGSRPDSTASKIYDAPILLTSTSKIKTIVCKQGWYCSDVFEVTCFLEGRKLMDAELLSETVKYYSGQGSVSLTDGWKGFAEVLNTPFWLGFKENPFVAGFDFGLRPPDLTTIVISYARNLSSSAFPPLEVEVWGGKSSKENKLIKKLKIEQPRNYESPQVEALFIPLGEVSYSFYKVVAKPVDKLPNWHNEKGKRALLMIDEVFFY